MPEVSEEELTIIENVLVSMRQALEEDDSPEATQMKEQILEAEQIVSSKIEQQSVAGEGAITGPGV